MSKPSEPVKSHAEWAAPASDPRPTPPEAPGPGECCESGCDPCVWDFYNQEMDHHRQELARWLARHPESQ